MKKFVAIFSLLLCISFSANAGVAFKTGEQRKQNYTICYYSYLGNDYQMVVDFGQLCPLSINVN